MQQYNYRSCITTLCYCTRRGLRSSSSGAAATTNERRSEYCTSTCALHSTILQLCKSGDKHLYRKMYSLHIWTFTFLSQFKKINRDLKLQSCYLVLTGCCSFVAIYFSILGTKDLLN